MHSKAAPHFRCEILSELPSTSAELFARSAQENIHGLAVIARVQTAGVGRRGRTWATFPGNLAMSLGLEFSTAESLSLLPVWAGICVYEALQNFLPPDLRGQISLKWPNDIVAGPEQRKLCGILSQVRVQGETQKIALGIGLNLKKYPEGEGIWATSLEALAGDAPALEDFLPFLMKEFSQRWPLLENPQKLCAEWETRAHFLGKKIRFGSLEEPQTMRAAKALRLLPDGALLVEMLDGGEQIALLSDDISLRLN